MGLIEWLEYCTIQKRACALKFSLEQKSQKQKMPSKKIYNLDGSEQSMIPIIKMGMKQLSCENKKNSLVALEEFSVGTGISDLTIFSIDKQLLTKRKKRDTQPLTEKIYIDILMYVASQKGVSLDEIIGQLKDAYSRGLVTKGVKKLEELGAIRLDKGCYAASLDLKLGSSQKIIAIEAKVRDWRSGLRQAMRYQEYADYSYLAVYEKHVAKCIENKDIFESLGIGLIGVSDQGIQLHWAAQSSSTLNDENKILAFERCLSFTDDRYEPFVVRNNFVSNHPTRIAL